MPVLVQTNYQPVGDGIAGALNGIDRALGMGQTLQANLLDAGHAVNSAGNKWTGRRVFVTDRGVIVTAQGSATNSPWSTPDGVYVVTPI